MPTLQVSRSNAFSLSAVLAVLLTSVSLCGQTGVNVTTWHNDPGRTGQNRSETTLTPGNVNQAGNVSPGTLSRVSHAASVSDQAPLTDHGALQ